MRKKLWVVKKDDNEGELLVMAWQKKTKKAKRRSWRRLGPCNNNIRMWWQQKLPWGASLVVMIWHTRKKIGKKRLSWGSLAL